MISIEKYIVNEYTFSFYVAAAERFDSAFFFVIEGTISTDKNGAFRYKYPNHTR